METQLVPQKNKWQNQRINRHFNNQKKKQYVYCDRRWSRKHTNSAKIYNGPGPNGCRCCAIHGNEHRPGPATDAKRRNLSIDPQLAALNKKYSMQQCLIYDKIDSNDSNIETQINKLNMSNLSYMPNEDQFESNKYHSTITLNEFLPKELQNKSVTTAEKMNYYSDDQKSVINMDKLMISMNNNEYGLISKRLKNLITKYHIVQTLLPHVKKIRQSVIKTNKNQNICVDSLIKKKFISKLNDGIYGEYDIMCTSKIDSWTENLININNIIDIKKYKYNNALIRISGIESLVYGYWRRSDINIVAVDVVNLCLMYCYCNAPNIAYSYQALLPYNFNIERFSEKTKLMVQCCKTKDFRLRKWEKMFVCLVFKDKKKKLMESNMTNMYSFMNVLPILSISKMDDTPIEKSKYWRRGYSYHSYATWLEDKADHRMVKFKQSLWDRK